MKREKSKVAVSVIIPTYNSERFIETTIKSVITQEYENWECIVVDDGSQDKTHEIVKKLSDLDERIYFIQREKPPKGANRCRNIGILKSNGSYLIFLDSDDILLKHCLKNRVLAMERFEPDLMINGVFDMEGKKKTSQLHNKIYYKNTDFLKLFLKMKNPWHTTSGTWKKEFIVRIGMFDEQLQRLQDPDIHIRALRDGTISLCYKYKEADAYYRLSNSAFKIEKEVKKKIIHSFEYFLAKYWSLFRDTKYERDLLEGVAFSIAYVNNLVKNYNLNKGILFTYLCGCKRKGYISALKFQIFKVICYMDQIVWSYPNNNKIMFTLIRFIMNIIPDGYNTKRS